MIFSQAGDLPHHIYCKVDMAHTRLAKTGFEDCVWFGLNSTHGRLWGCNVLLECGAIYRNVPIHKLAWGADPQLVWGPEDAQVWDCYGPQYTLLEYKYLASTDVETRKAGLGQYLCTAAPIGDGYSREPSQAKEFTFIRLENGRFAVLPTDHIIVHETSFTNARWPDDIKRQTETYSCENADDCFGGRAET